MKKTYITPALEIVHVQVQQMMALSMVTGKKATADDALVKGGDWDIFGENSVVDEESGSFFEE